MRGAEMKHKTYLRYTGDPQGLVKYGFEQWNEERWIWRPDKRYCVGLIVYYRQGKHFNDGRIGTNLTGIPELVTLFDMIQDGVVEKVCENG